MCNWCVCHKFEQVAKYVFYGSLAQLINQNRIAVEKPLVSDPHEKLNIVEAYVELQDQWNGPYFFFLKSIAQPPVNETAPIFFLGEFSYHIFML